jgi:major type 1 subunit fimbrin (pilin)
MYCHFAIRNPQSAIAIRNPQSAIRNPQSAIRNPQSDCLLDPHPSRSICYGMESRIFLE